MPDQQISRESEVRARSIAKVGFRPQGSSARAVVLGVASCVGGRLALEFLVIITAVFAVAFRGVSPDQMAVELGQSLFLQTILIAIGVWSCALGGYIAANICGVYKPAIAGLSGLLAIVVWILTDLLWPGSPGLVHLTVLAAAIPAALLGGHWANRDSCPQKA